MQNDNSEYKHTIIIWVISFGNTVRIFISQNVWSKEIANTRKIHSTINCVYLFNIANGIHLCYLGMRLNSYISPYIKKNVKCFSNARSFARRKHHPSLKRSFQNYKWNRDQRRTKTEERATRFIFRTFSPVRLLDSLASNNHHYHCLRRTNVRIPASALTCLIVLI